MKNKRIIHWWKLPEECPIKIKQNYLEKIISTTSNRKIKRRTLENMIAGKKQPRVKTIKRFLNSINMKFDSIEKKITHVKTHNKLIKIKFPIKESPLHLQVLSHGMFDGSKEDNACLRYKVRHDVPTKELFRELLEKCFGKDCYGHTDNCYFLYKSFSNLLANHYGIKEFNSKKTYLSNYVMHLCKNPNFRRAILKAAFIDEGHAKHNTTSKNHEKLRLTLVSSIKNEKLALQLLHLTKLEGFKASLYRARNNSEFTISILKKSKKDFYKNILGTLPDNHRKKKEVRNALTKDF